MWPRTVRHQALLGATHHPPAPTTCPPPWLFLAARSGISHACLVFAGFCASRCVLSTSYVRVPHPVFLALQLGRGGRGGAPAGRLVTALAIRDTAEMCKNCIVCRPLIRSGGVLCLCSAGVQGGRG